MEEGFCFLPQCTQPIYFLFTETGLREFFDFLSNFLLQNEELFPSVFNHAIFLTSDYYQDLLFLIYLKTMLETKIMIKIRQKGGLEKQKKNI